MINILFNDKLTNAEQSFNNTASEVWKIMNIVGGALLGVAVLWCLGAIILAFVQNSQTTDPQKKKANNLKIFWAIGAVVVILFFWGIAAVVVSSVASARQNVNPYVSNQLLNNSIIVLKNNFMVA